MDVECLDYFCLILLDVKVEEGFYWFELQLFQLLESYFIVYQWCCCNVMIFNIIVFGDIGFIFFIEIMLQAQQVCNNSFVFNEFFLIIICVGVFLEFDYSVIDVDGYQLVYSLCFFYDGGGNLFIDLFYLICEGVCLGLACLLFYNMINFLGLNFMFIQLMGLEVNLQIDFNIGLLMGMLINLGQYVVVVCVQEFDVMGNLLSMMIWDFQFNVVFCDFIVEVVVGVVDLNIDQEYVIVFCG